jgi:nucleoside-diphosphate-sugar epimerase
MFLNLSSSLVYGSFEQRESEIKENDLSIIDSNSVSTIYAEAKRYSESFCHAFRNQFRMPIVMMRPFSVIGPYQALTGPWALNNFINDAIHGRSIKILGDGQTIRSFLYAADMAFWTLKVLTHATSGTTYNLGSPEKVSLLELSSLVQSQFGKKADVILCAGSESAQTKSQAKNMMVPDTSLVQKQFGLKLIFPLPSAIERCIGWYQFEK